MITNTLGRSVFFLLFTASLACAAEPLVGTWKLTSQNIDNHPAAIDPVTLRIYPAGDALEFAYSMPVNGVHLVSLKFTSVHLDGGEGKVQNVQGKDVGTVKITRTGPLAYRAVIEGANRPKAVGKMTVSPDRQTLTSESDSTLPGKGATHAVQVFTRN